MQQIAQISGRLLSQQIRVRTIPAGLINTAAAVLGRFNPMVKDLAAMMRWFQTGKYVADPARQGEVFGEVPTAEDAISRLIRSLGHGVSDGADVMPPRITDD
jgi:hypothetical protein